VVGGYAYVADAFEGLLIIDVSYPRNPFPVGRYNTLGIAMDVEVAGNHAYVADFYHGLSVIDVSDPARPTEVGQAQTSNLAYDVTVVEREVYVADRAGGLRSFDVSDPSHPVATGYYQTGRYAYGVSNDGSRVYVGAGEDGLYILSRVARPGDEESVPTGIGPTLHESFPNPFNPRTVISFDLPVPARVSLVVYDVAGRVVRVLADDVMEAGTKRLVWDGRDSKGEAASSGVYFYRLSAGGRTLTKKTVLVR
jgi:hypothetical protein